jgi:hypothetical protein
MLIEKSKKNKEEEQLEEVDEPNPMDVFTDGMLSILARPPAPLRDLVKYMFTAFGDQVTQHSLHIMLKALQNDADDDVNDDEDEEEEEEDEEEIGSGAIDDDDDKEEEDDDYDSDDDSDISYDSQDNDEGFTLTKEQIRKAFENQMEDSDLESLGDADMEPFDRALESMFKEKKAAKNEKKRTYNDNYNNSCLIILH